MPLKARVFVAGASIQWLRDEMKIIADATDSEYFATKVKDSNGVYVVPAFTGRAPLLIRMRAVLFSA